MAIRYDSNEVDSAEVQDGDVGFFALDSRTEPENLAPGVLSVSENMRLNRRVAETREGMDKVTNSIDPGGTVPLIVPFTVGANAIVRDTWADGLFASCVFSDPDDSNQEWLFLATGSSCFAYNETDGVTELAYPSGQTVVASDEVEMFQAENSVYILRGQSAASQSVSRISRSGTTATLQIDGGHGMVSNDYATITGSYPAWYNTSEAVVTVSNSTTLTYTTGSPTNLADSLLEAATNSTHYLQQSQEYSGATYTFSVYCKPNGRDWVNVYMVDAFGAPFGAYFNISSGTVGTTANATGSIVNAGGGWFRCIVTGAPTYDPLAGSDGVVIATATADSTDFYAGDITKGVFVFGAQLELGSSASNYEATSGAEGVRNLLTYSDDFSNAVWTKTNATVSANSTGEPATGTIYLNQNKVPLRWDGDFSTGFTKVSHGTIAAPYIYMPCSDFGILQQNRAILQYTRNQAIISDVLDVESYDSLFGVFTFASGQADYLIGFHPYQDNKTLVFNRRSIYLINDVDLDVNMMTSQEVTRQVGCVSRNSIATCGPDVLFLSDLGVFRLQPGLELQLRGNSEPLSAPIDDVIQTINQSAIQRACSAYCNNRYYIAVPVSSATRNNRILVYSFLNGAWESVDTLPNGMYADFLEVKQYNNVDTLFVISQEGGVYAYEQLEYDEYGAAGSDPTTFTIAGRMVSRRLTMSSYNLKHFNRLTTNLSLNANSSCTIKVNTVNPDATKTLKSYAVTAATDVTYPLLVNKRGYGIDLEITNTAGRTTVNNYSIVGYEQSRKNIKIT